MKKTFIHKKALVEKGAKVGAGTRVWAFVHILPGAVIGKDGNIGDHCFIEGKARLGDRVTLKNGVSVWDAVSIGNDAFIGPNAVFTNDLFPKSRKRTPFVPTHIGSGVTIGANATIVCGVRLGDHSFVGAGSVVTKDIPAYALVYGNPAVIKNFVCSCRKKLKFIGNRAACMCGHVYNRQSKDKVVPAR